MKTTRYHFLAFMLPAALCAQTQVPVDPNCCGNDPEGTVFDIRPQASADVVNARRGAAVNGYQNAGFQSLESKVEIRVEKASFLSGSEFLVGANGFLILPKGSVVTPGRGLKLLQAPPENGEILELASFQQFNRSVFRLLPVTEAMLNGEEEALKEFEKKITALKAGGIAYLTTLNGSPVSLPRLSASQSK